MYPENKEMAGSDQCVDALIKEMKALGKIAIVRFQPTRLAQIKICALIPVDGKNHAGFYMVVLPYADDIRDMNDIFDISGYNKEA